MFFYFVGRYSSLDREDNIVNRILLNTMTRVSKNSKLKINWD